MRNPILATLIPLNHIGISECTHTKCSHVHCYQMSHNIRPLVWSMCVQIPTCPFKRNAFLLNQIWQKHVHQNRWRWPNNLNYPILVEANQLLTLSLLYENWKIEARCKKWNPTPLLPPDRKWKDKEGMQTSVQTCSTKHTIIGSNLSLVQLITHG